jgi:hypothetical protein
MIQLRYGFFLALLGLLVIVLAACGDGDDEPAPTATVATTVATATSPSTSAPAVAAAAPTRAVAVATVTPRPPTLPPSPAAAPAQNGEIQVRVTDAPPDGVSAIWVTVSRIEVQKADSEGESGWVPVVEMETKFDLVAVTGIEEVLGTSEFEPGQYGQIRMEVVEVTVTYQGRDIEANVPSSTLKVVRGFEVEAGVTTILTLDFDADKSVVITGAGPVQVKPVVKLLVRKTTPEEAAAPVPTPVAGATETPEPTEVPVPTEVPEPTETPEPTSTPTPTPTPTIIPTPTATPDALAEEFFLYIVSPQPEPDEEIIFVTEPTVTLVGRTRIDAAVTVDDTFMDLDDDGQFEITLELEESFRVIEVVASTSEEELSLVLTIAYEP